MAGRDPAILFHFASSAAELAVGGVSYYLGVGLNWVASLEMTFRLVFRFLVLALIAGALLFAPMPGHSGHDVTALISVEDAAHGHDHDHDHDHPHLPGHDATDHSHQFLFMADNVAHSAFASASRWRLMAFSLPDSGIASGLERPPRQA